MKSGSFWDQFPKVEEANPPTIDPKEGASNNFWNQFPKVEDANPPSTESPPSQLSAPPSLNGGTNVNPQIQPSFGSMSPEDHNTQEKIDEAKKIFQAKGSVQTLNAAYDNYKKLPPKQQKQLFDDFIRLAIKAPAAGASSVLDFFSTTPFNAAIDAVNGSVGSKIRHAKSFEKTAEDGIDYLADKVGIDTKGGGPVYEGVKFATALAVPGGGASKLKYVNPAIKATSTVDIPKLANTLSSIGSTNAKTIVGAAGAGAAMKYAEDQGVGTLGSLASGAGGALSAEGLVSMNKKNIANTGAKIIRKVAGVDKKNLKVDALDSAERLGVDLPLAATTDAIVPALSHQLISKTPILGNKLVEKNKQASGQFQQAWTKLLDSVAPNIDRELSGESERIYKVPRNLLRETDTISPSHILDQIKAVREEIKSPIYSESTKNLTRYLNEFEGSILSNGGNKAVILKDGLEGMPQDIQKQVMEKYNASNKITNYPVKELLRAKIEINKISRDKNLFDRTDKDTMGLLSRLRHSVINTLNEYGKTNPKWHKAFKEAELEYGQLAKRENLDDVLSGKIWDPVTDDVSFIPLIKVLKDPKQQNFLKNNLGQKNYQKLNDFIEVAKSMSSIKTNTLNPSGTAITSAVLGMIQGIVFGTNIFPALGGGLAAWGGSHILTNKNFLNLAHRFAKQPTDTLAQKINGIVKEHTGMSAQALMKKAKNEEDKKQVAD